MNLSPQEQISVYQVATTLLGSLLLVVGMLSLYYRTLYRSLAHSTLAFMARPTSPRVGDSRYTNEAHFVNELTEASGLDSAAVNGLLGLLVKHYVTTSIREVAESVSSYPKPNRVGKKEAETWKH